MTALDVAQRYFFDRASNDLDLMQLLRGGEPVHRIVRGLPDDTLQEEDFPRLAFTAVANLVDRDQIVDANGRRRDCIVGPDVRD